LFPRSPPQKKQKQKYRVYPLSESQWHVLFPLFAGAGQEAQDVPVVEAVAVPIADTIASAEVVLNDDGQGNEARENASRAWMAHSFSIQAPPP
jgi:hypothetical protein